MSEPFAWLFVFHVLEGCLDYLCQLLESVLFSHLLECLELSQFHLWLQAVLPASSIEIRRNRSIRPQQLHLSTRRALLLGLEAISFEGKFANVIFRLFHRRLSFAGRGFDEVFQLLALINPTLDSIFHLLPFRDEMLQMNHLIILVLLERAEHHLDLLHLPCQRGIILLVDGNAGGSCGDGLHPRVIRMNKLSLYK